MAKGAVRNISAAISSLHVGIAGIFTTEALAIVTAWRFWIGCSGEKAILLADEFKSLRVLAEAGKW
jgi:uncharacterized membrane protein